MQQEELCWGWERQKPFQNLFAPVFRDIIYLLNIHLLVKILFHASLPLKKPATPGVPGCWLASAPLPQWPLQEGTPRCLESPESLRTSNKVACSEWVFIYFQTKNYKNHSWLREATPSYHLQVYSSYDLPPAVFIEWSPPVGSQGQSPVEGRFRRLRFGSRNVFQKKKWFWLYGSV